jgi:hypothetical protein
MQDELTKHGLKIYKTMTDRKHSFGEKLREILIEILIIVFAVTLSIGLHSWSEHQREQKEVHEFLRGLKVDLNEDILLLKQNHDTIAVVDKNFATAFQLRKNQLPDSLVHHYFYYSMVVTNPNNARYEGFKSSGKLGNIEDDSLREAILVYYQRTAPDIIEHEGLVNKLQEKILDYQIDKTDIPINEFVAITKVKGMLQIATQNTQHSLYLYEKSIKQVKKIIGLIDRYNL